MWKREETVDKAEGARICPLLEAKTEEGMKVETGPPNELGSIVAVGTEPLMEPDAVGKAVADETIGTVTVTV